MSATPLRPPLRRVVSKFASIGRPYAAVIAVALVVILVASGARMGQSYLIKPVIDEFSRGEDRLDRFLKEGDLAEAADEIAVLEQRIQHDDASDREQRGLRERFAALAVKLRDPAFESAAQGNLAVLRERLRAIPRDSAEARAISEAVHGVPSTPILFLRNIALLAVGLSIVMFVFGVLKDYMTNYLSKRVTADIRYEVVEHMTHLPLRHFHDRKSGDLLSRVTHDVQATEQASTFFFDDVLVHPLWALSGIGLIFFANWQLALCAVALFPLYVWPMLKLGRLMRRARLRSLESMGDMTQTMVQTLGGIKVVKAFNMEAAQVAEFRRHNETFLARWLKSLRRKVVSENLSQIYLGFSLALLLFGGGFLLAQRVMTPGDITIFALGIAMINSSVRELSKSYNRMLEASAAADRVFELLDVAREPSHATGEDLDGVVGGVEYRGVSFAYGTEPVLQDIDLAIAPGEVVALVGRSGAGKTTLCDLLCRYYDPTAGRILVGGKDVRGLRRGSLLRHVSIVAQDTFLFHASIGDNIRYSRPDADRAAVEAAARAANIHDFIAGLERGYDTIVGERGAKLSGGQRQRVAIARAVLKDPDILILDEATSALDSESEKLVQQALAGLIRGGRRRITLVIAHRLSTVRDADRIVVLDGGRIVESGRHDDLISRGGVYSSLYRTQFSEEDLAAKPPNRQAVS